MGASKRGKKQILRQLIHEPGAVEQRWALVDDPRAQRKGHFVQDAKGLDMWLPTTKRRVDNL